MPDLPLPSNRAVPGPAQSKRALVARRTLYSGFAAAALLGLAACGGSASEDSAKSAQLWRHGMVQAKADAGFATMVAAQGFAAKRGLNVDIKQFKGDALALRALLAGELDSYEGSPGGPLMAAARGAQIKVIGCYWPTMTVDLYAKSSIASADQLKGKTFAISSPGSLPDILARAILVKHGVKSDDVRFAVMGSDADRIRALWAGVVDVASASSEFTPMAASSNFKVLFKGAEEAPEYPRLCIYSTPKAMAAPNQPAARFLAAESEAMTFALANRDATLALTAKATGRALDDPQAAYLYDEVKQLNAVDPTLAIPAPKLQWLADLLVETHNIPAKFDVTGFIDPAPRAAGLKLLQP